MAAPVFIEAEYADPPCTGLETREADGTWLGATAYTHATRGNVVLWYGATYEGLGGGYRWCAGGAPPVVCKHQLVQPLPLPPPNRRASCRSPRRWPWRVPSGWTT